MNVAIYGLGYVGLTASCCIAKQGHTVFGVDPNDSKVSGINAKESPIVEPQISELLENAVDEGRLTAATDLESLDHIDLAIVCVGTPSAQDGSHNMGFIADVSRQIASGCSGKRTKPLVVSYRSTMRPGSMEELVAPIFKSVLGPETFEANVELVYNPEFLREGSAVFDYFNPPKIVVGTDDSKPNAVMEALHDGIDATIFTTGFREAEITKFVDNTWHAVKVAFANEIGRVCLDLNIDAGSVHKIFVSDTKLNISPYYMRPGGPFGGSCLPKDVRALSHISREVNAQTPMIDHLLDSNERHKVRLLALATKGLEPGAKILLAGLAFKAGTDDLRESPNVDLARGLLSAGYDLDIFDPAIDAQRLIGVNLGYAYSKLPAIQSLLVDKETASKGDYSRIIATNATVKALENADPAKILDLGSL